MIYLDNCATTKPKEAVVQAMERALRDDFFNPSSLHRKGVEVEKEKERIRKAIKAFLGCREGELYFTSGATESSNTAIRAFLKGADSTKNVVTTNVEHPSILNTLNERGIPIRKVAIDATGHISKDALFSSIDSDTVLVSLFHINNELGSINPVEEWVPEIKKAYPRVHVHIDGVQAVGKIPVHFDQIGCDSYSFSGHKFHGPKGIGGLLLKKPVRPLIFGGGQEMGLRSGTENIPGIYGLGAAFRAIEEEGLDVDGARARWEYLRRGLEAIDDIKINTLAPASPYILNVSINHTRGEVLLHILEEKEIYISTSSACSSHRTGKNPILEALHLSESMSEGTIRICLSRETTREELDVFLDELKRAVESVRDIMGR